MTEEKIACHVCKAEIPKSAALSTEGKDYVLYYCSTDCMDYYKDKEEKKSDKKQTK